MTIVKGRLLPTLALCLMIAGPAMAQTLETYSGDWTGVLEAGPKKMRVALHMKTDAGVTTAVLDSLDEGVSLPATAIKIEGGDLNLLFLSAGGELRVKPAPDGRSLTGVWEKGATFPITLTKQATASAGH